MNRYCKRLIEVDLPIKRISAHAQREKSIRHGHISTLHIWWARRPLAACRAVICASLWPDPVDELCSDEFREIARNQMIKWANNYLHLLSEESFPRFVVISKDESKLYDMPELRSTLLDFIADFSNWDNSSIPEYLETSRLLTQISHESFGGESGSRPFVMDPFAGGGAIPIEALRVGSNVFASDLNPLAVSLNRVFLEYGPRFSNELVEKFSKWTKILLKENHNSLQKYYIKDESKSQLIGYLWARTIVCEGPNCGVVVPIVKSFNLSLRKNYEAAIQFFYEEKQVRSKVIKGVDAKNISGGTSRRSDVTCPNCNFTTKRKRVEVQANEKGLGYYLYAVCHQDQDGKRHYREPHKNDLRILSIVEKDLAEWEKRTFDDVSAIPNEELPYLRSIFNVRVYGLNEWHLLFNRRQLLSTLLIVENVRNVGRRIFKEDGDGELSHAIFECICLAVSGSLQYQCNIATYLTESIKSAFIQGQSLPMKFDFVEANPLLKGLAGGTSYSIEKVLNSLKTASRCFENEGTVQQVSALSAILPENSIDIVATDPPYYDVVPYADCSDFFFVWLKRMTIGFSKSFSTTSLTPKKEEIVQLAERNIRYSEKTKEWFEEKITESLSLRRNEIKTNGLAVVVFAHKETDAWESLLKGILKAGWLFTASWPIATENETRMRANASAVLGSSVHLVCRPRQNPDGSLITDNIGYWRDVLDELPGRIHEWMPRLAEEGVVGADAIFACLGPSLEIYSRYSSVEKASGEKVELREYLEEVWAAVSREALNMIFDGADSSGFEEDARLTAMWLWTLKTAVSGWEIDEGDDSEKTKTLPGYSLEFDAARKIAQGLGAHLENLSHLVEIKGNTAMLLSAANRTKYLFGKETTESPRGERKKKIVQETLFDFGEDIKQIEDKSNDWGGELSAKAGSTILDQLHQSMILFGVGRGDAIKRFLVEEGVGRNPLFWSLAQALSALYPAGTDEKRWVDGVMARKKGLGL